MTLLTSDYQEGLRVDEWRWPSDGGTHYRPELKVPLWDGSPLSGRSLLLWCEQGFGDVLQFVRFVSRIPKDGGRIVLQAPRKLSRLLATCEGVDQVVVDGDWLDADVQFPLISVPLALGVTLDTVGETPYLRPPEHVAAADELIPRDSSVVNVGCVWASGTIYQNHGARDCGIESIAALSEVPRVRLFSLQYGLRAPDALPYAAQIADLSGNIGDFATTAAFVKRCDLIITVDTAMAHLAGALGAPVWLLLQAQPERRWMADRPDSPWYPTMRIYRQSLAGEWADALQRVRNDLEALARERGCTGRVAPSLSRSAAGPRTSSNSKESVD
jgi:hypothetical protein